LEEIIVGFLLAFVVGVGLAFLMFQFPVLEKTFYPIVIGSQTIPVFAIAPLLVLWFGYGLPSKVVMAALIVFFPIVVNTLDGLKGADSDAVNLLRILKANRWQILWKVRVPSALPFIFSGCKIGISVSTIGAIIGEWVGSKEGLGYLMLHANAQLQISLIFASLIYLTILGVSLFYLIVLMERWVMPWKRLSEAR
jgi:ABC-type nitrate/sulfonate/bicarbonate transport system permease component